MKIRHASLFVALVLSCRRSSSTTSAEAGLVEAGRPRVVCAPVQGPTRLRDADAGDEFSYGTVSSADHRATLSFETVDAHGAAVYVFTLTAQKEPPRVVRLSKGDAAMAPKAFRGPNVIGFRADSTVPIGDDGHIVWATVEPRSVNGYRVKGDVVTLGSKVYFNDDLCKLHEIDLQSGAHRKLPTKACSRIDVWAGALALGKPRYFDAGTASLFVGTDFGEVVVDPSTGRELPAPHCPHPVGTGCVTFDSDLHHEFDDDPPGPESSPVTLRDFEVRGPRGEIVRGQTSRPHAGLSPNHVTLWQDAAGQTLAFVAARVEGRNGPHLVEIDASHLSVTPISPEEEVDQRRLSRLAAFVPAGTAPGDVAALLRERKSALSAAENDRVRFVPYPEAMSAKLPCTAPPP